VLACPQLVASCPLTVECAISCHHGTFRRCKRGVGRQIPWRLSYVPDVFAYAVRLRRVLASPRGGDPLCVTALCRRCHRAYDRGELDLLPYLYLNSRVI
jgi:hypothetical protein